MMSNENLGKRSEKGTHLPLGPFKKKLGQQEEDEDSS